MPSLPSAIRRLSLEMYLSLIIGKYSRISDVGENLWPELRSAVYVLICLFKI